MKKQSIKWYFKNEKKVMKKLGFDPVPGSGSGWIFKEDGENENFIAQLKTTSANSYKLDRVDLDKLEYHAMVAHKIPVFINQFLEDGQIYLTIPVQYFDECIKLWQDTKSLSEEKSGSSTIDLDDLESIPQNEHKMIKSGNRLKYNKMIEREKQAQSDKYLKELKARKRKR